MGSARTNGLRSLIIGFGFLNGVWMAIGFDPSEEILRIIVRFIRELGLPSYVIQIINILSILLVFLSIYLIYKYGKELGIVAVIIGFLGGLLILKSPVTGITLLIAAIIIGFIAAKYRFSFKIFKISSGKTRKYKKRR